MTNEIAGGFGEENPNDPTVIRAAKLALDAYIEKHRKIPGVDILFDKVTKAEAQAVAGTNYRLKFDARVTLGFSKYLCDALVYQSFDHKLSVLNVDCKFQMAI